MLHPYGIGPDTESAYAAMPPEQPVAVDVFTRHLPHTTSIVEVLAQLRSAGLAVETSDGRWQATPLPVAVTMLQSKRITDLEQAAHQVGALETVVDDSLDTDHGLVRIERLDNRNAITEFLWHTCATATLMQTFDRPPYGNPRNEEPSLDYLRTVSPEWQILDHGGTIQTVYHPNFRNNPRSRRELALWIDHGEQARFAEVSTKLMIVDHDTIMVPSMSRYHQMAEAEQHGEKLEPAMAVISGHDILTEIFTNLFEQTWAAALPLANNPAGGDSVIADPKKCDVAKMLLDGKSLDQVATRYARNPRTLRRWHDEIMAQTGAASDVELGARLRDLEHQGLLENLPELADDT